jgi:hypothetical protein
MALSVLGSVIASGLSAASCRLSRGVLRDATGAKAGWTGTYPSCEIDYSPVARRNLPQWGGNPPSATAPHRQIPDRLIR